MDDFEILKWLSKGLIALGVLQLMLIIFGIVFGFLPHQPANLYQNLIYVTG